MKKLTLYPLPGGKIDLEKVEEYKEYRNLYEKLEKRNKIIDRFNIMAANLKHDVIILSETVSYEFYAPANSSVPPSETDLKVKIPIVLLCIFMEDVVTVNSISKESKKVTAPYYYFELRLTASIGSVAQSVMYTISKLLYGDRFEYQYIDIHPHIKFENYNSGLWNTYICTNNRSFLVIPRDMIILYLNDIRTESQSTDPIYLQYELESYILQIRNFLKEESDIGVAFMSIKGVLGLAFRQLPFINLWRKYKYLPQGITPEEEDKLEAAILEILEEKGMYWIEKEFQLLEPGNYIVTFELMLELKKKLNDDKLLKKFLKVDLGIKDFVLPPSNRTLQDLEESSMVLRARHVNSLVSSIGYLNMDILEELQRLYDRKSPLYEFTIPPSKRLKDYAKVLNGKDTIYIERTPTYVLNYTALETLYMKFFVTHPEIFEKIFYHVYKTQLYEKSSTEVLVY